MFKFSHLQRSRWTALAAGDTLSALSDFELLSRSHDLRGEALHRPLAANDVSIAFALVREAARRAHGTPHYPVQLQAGELLQQGHAVEMRTGEGKSLTVLLTAYVLALTGKGCHLLTANDYLAERDAHHARQVFERLGLTVDWIGQASTPDERQRAYACDVTYTTVNQLGFDLLRDRVRERTGVSLNGLAEGVQRPLAAAVIDEADLVMLDEARTPLLLAHAVPLPETMVVRCRWAAELCGSLTREDHFQVFPNRKTAQLTEAGCQQVLLAARPAALSEMTEEAIYQAVERAFEAQLLYEPDHDYILRNQRVELIGSTTGRVLAGRQWQNGLQPAIEWRAGAEFSPGTESSAAITIQSLLNLYPFLCGMSGTLWTDRSEMSRIYGMPVSAVPPRLPSRLKGWEPRCFQTMTAKIRAIVHECHEIQQAGRAVLVGAPTIETSLQISHALKDAQLPHELLTAREPEREAEITATAGTAGRITISTNMAGRGTDINLSEEVRKAGGLHVIVAGMQGSQRTDRQLIGRAGRQGDPGTHREFLSWDDELFSQQGLEAKVAKWKRTAWTDREGEISPRHRSRFLSVQQAVERRHFQERLQLFEERKSLEKWAQKVGIDPCLDWLEDHRAA